MTTAGDTTAKGAEGGRGGSHDALKSLLSEHQCPDAAALASDLAALIAQCLRSALTARGTALLAVSGGSSPKPIFARLSQQTLDWSRVVVTQVDERWVPLDHPDSNARLIRDHLLQNQAAKARFVPFKNSAATPEAGQAACEALLLGLPLPFDVVLLGMGEDGHTASLFPQAPELTAALAPEGPLCAAVNPPAAPHPRMSLTLRGLLTSRRLVLPLTGAAKLEVLRDAQGPGAVEAMPIRAVLRQSQVPVELWLAA